MIPICTNENIDFTLINPQCLTTMTQATAGTIDHPCAKHRTVLIPCQFTFRSI